MIHAQDTANKIHIVIGSEMTIRQKGNDGKFDVIEVTDVDAFIESICRARGALNRQPKPSNIFDSRERQGL